MTTPNNVKFSIEELVRAIRDGEMPDGADVCDDAYLDAVAEALDALNPVEIDALMRITGSDTAAAAATAERLSEMVQWDSASINDRVCAEEHKAVASDFLVPPPEANGDAPYLCGSFVERATGLERKAGKLTGVGGLSAPGGSFTLSATNCSLRGFSLAREVLVGAENAAPPDNLSSVFWWIVSSPQESLSTTHVCDQCWSSFENGSVSVKEGDVVVVNVNGKVMLGRANTDVDGLTLANTIMNGAGASNMLRNVFAFKSKSMKRRQIAVEGD
jgi:hypothetical protein